MPPYRPKIQLSLTKADKVLEAAALLLFAAIWVFAMLSYASSPDQIPVRLSMDGKSAAYGSRAAIFVGAGIATCLYFLCTIINRYPHRMNYMITLTPENAAAQYQHHTRLARWIKLGSMALVLALSQVAMPGRTWQASGYVILLIAIIVIIGTPIAVAFYSTKPRRKMP